MGKEITLRNYFNRFPVKLLHSPFVASSRYEFPFLSFPFFFLIREEKSRSFARIVTFLTREEDFSFFFLAKAEDKIFQERREKRIILEEESLGNANSTERWCGERNNSVFSEFESRNFGRMNDRKRCDFFFPFSRIKFNWKRFSGKIYIYGGISKLEQQVFRLFFTGKFLKIQIWTDAYQPVMHNKRVLT